MSRPTICANCGWVKPEGFLGGCPACNRKEEDDRRLERQEELQRESAEAAKLSAEAAKLANEEMREIQKQALEDAAEQDERAREALEDTLAHDRAEKRRLLSEGWKLEAESKADRARFLFDSGLYEDAGEMAQAALRVDPANISALCCLIKTSLRAGHKTVAKECWGKLRAVVRVSGPASTFGFLMDSAIEIGIDRDVIDDFVGQLYAAGWRKGSDFPAARILRHLLALGPGRRAVEFAKKFGGACTEKEALEIFGLQGGREVAIEIARTQGVDFSSSVLLFAKFGMLTDPVEKKLLMARGEVLSSQQLKNLIEASAKVIEQRREDYSGGEIAIVGGFLGELFSVNFSRLFELDNQIANAFERSGLLRFWPWFADLECSSFLGIEVASISLARMPEGGRHKGSISLRNLGGGPLRGSISSDCDWLVISRKKIDGNCSSWDFEYEVHMNGIGLEALIMMVGVCFGMEFIGTIWVNTNAGSKLIPVKVSLEAPDVVINRFRMWFASVCIAIGAGAGLFFQTINGVGSLSINSELALGIAVPLYCVAFGAFFYLSWKTNEWFVGLSLGISIVLAILWGMSDPRYTFPLLAGLLSGAYGFLLARPLYSGLRLNCKSGFVLAALGALLVLGVTARGASGIKAHEVERTRSWADRDAEKLARFKERIQGAWAGECEGERAGLRIAGDNGSFTNAHNNLKFKVARFSNTCCGFYTTGGLVAAWGVGGGVGGPFIHFQYPISGSKRRGSCIFFIPNLLD